MEHKCEICEQNYSTKRGLKKHFMASHDQNGKLYYCNICTKSYQNQSSLTLHKKAIHETQKFKCDSCGKSFTGAQYLKKQRSQRSQM